jgi:colanic acid biosynthesis glycosyl transferase WcaI
MKVLMMTQYFPPEVGAAQTRLYETAQALLRCGLDAEVFTSMPSYPKGEIFDEYKGCFYKQINMDGIKVYRIWSYASNELGVIKRLFSYGSFTVLAALAFNKVKPRPDLIFVESPSLTLGITGFFLSKVWGCPWILNISDLWPDSIFALGAMRKDSWAGKSLIKLESFLYKEASGITAVTEGIITDLIDKKNVPEDKVFFLPNGANVEGFRPVKDLNNKVKKRFVYAGRIGSAQGLDILVKAAVLLKDINNIIILIIGDGPELPKLKALTEKYKLENIEFKEPVPLSSMPQVLQEAYAAVITLKDVDLLKGARPSKLMPAFASGLPIIYSGAGEGANLVKETCAGIVTAPEDEKALAEAVMWLADHPQAACEMGMQGRKFAEDHLDWNVLVKNWLCDVQERLIEKENDK